jgi:ubiquitin-protein ligase
MPPSTRGRDEPEAATASKRLKGGPTQGVAGQASASASSHIAKAPVPRLGPWCVSVEDEATVKAAYEAALARCGEASAAALNASKAAAKREKEDSTLAQKADAAEAAASASAVATAAAEAAAGAAACVAWAVGTPEVEPLDTGAFAGFEVGMEHLRGVRARVIKVEANHTLESLYIGEGGTTSAAYLIVSDGVSMLTACTTVPEVLALLRPHPVTLGAPAVGPGCRVLLDLDCSRRGTFIPLDVLAMTPLLEALDGAGPMEAAPGHQEMVMLANPLPAAAALDYGSVQASIVSMALDAQACAASAAVQAASAAQVVVPMTAEEKAAQELVKAAKLAAMAAGGMHLHPGLLDLDMDDDLDLHPHHPHAHHHHHHHHHDMDMELDNLFLTRNRPERTNWQTDRVKAEVEREDGELLAAANTGALEPFLALACATLSTLSLHQALARQAVFLAAVQRLSTELQGANSGTCVAHLQQAPHTLAGLRRLAAACAAYIHRMPAPGGAEEGQVAGGDALLVTSIKAWVDGVEAALAAADAQAAHGPDAAPAPVPAVVSYEDAMRGLVVTSCAALRQHTYAPPADGGEHTPNPCLKRLASELADLPGTLPLSQSAAVYVCVGEGDITRWRVAITGPEGTPYAFGAFVFDVHFPGTYPAVPPKVKNLTTGGGTVRFNPNLYNDGKVCLSLLGTWTGPGWDPAVSSALQVLVSIQSAIMTPLPFFKCVVLPAPTPLHSLHR